MLSPRILGLLLLLSGDAAAASRADFERALAEEQLVGAVWATVQPDGAVAIDAAGLKNASTAEPLRAEHRVQVGSITKTLIATGVLRLITQGRLALDTPVEQLVNPAKLENPWAANHPVTVRHLLDHTAGLDDSRLWQVFSLKPTADTPLAAAFPLDRGLLRIRSQPGARFSYSNMGYALLGMVIEKITGERYEQYLDRHLLQPLGMRDSTFKFVSQRDDPRLAMGHFEHAETHHAVPSYVRPATQFTTTAADMARFARFLMSDGRADGQLFIDPSLLRRMGEPLGTEAARAGLQAGYGLGLYRRDRHDAIGRCHGGNTVGFRAMLCIFPEQQAAFFIAFNMDSETANHGRFDQMLVESLQLTGLSPAKRGVPPGDIQAWDGLYVPAPNRFASFAWVDEVFGFMHVRWDGQHLQLQSLNSGNRPLMPLGGEMFQAPGRMTASHVLLRSPEGRRFMSDGVQTFKRTGWTRMALLWASLAGGVLGILLILVLGITRLIKRTLRLAQPLFIPFAAVVAALLAIPLFLPQSFLQLGDVTIASVYLAAATLALPFAMLIGFRLRLQQGLAGGMARLEMIALLVVLQWMLVLTHWDLIPLRLWR